MKILVVEDDPISALTLMRTLEKFGHEVVISEDGCEGWQQVLHGTFHMIISDWMMPCMSGIDLCRKVRSHSFDYYTYFILLTGKDSRDDKLEGLRAGADDLLTKPMDSGELYARIEVGKRILEMETSLCSAKKELEEKNLLLSRLAVTDGLTGLFNHRSFYQHLNKEIERAGRLRSPLSVILLDLDFFKKYNDTFGHLAGDEILRSTAHILSSHARTYDVVARYGGEEFIILLPNTCTKEAIRVAERLRGAIEAGGEKSCLITASFGIATLEDGVITSSEFIDHADKALYASKRAGRNRVTHSMWLMREIA